MQQKAREQASSVVEISIYDAFALEMQTELGIVREHDRARYDAMLDAWIKSKVSAAMTMAQPWIGICNTVGATTMSVYLAMHPDKAVRMDNTPSVEATAARYLKIITVINPHLNKYWCEEGFLPSIYPSQRIVDEKNNMRAFFYALTLEKPCCVRLKNTKGKISWWFLRGMDTIRVKAAGVPIASSYADLYEAMKFNRDMK